MPPRARRRADDRLLRRTLARPAVDDDGRDLRLGLPLYLAEAVRFGTNAAAVRLAGRPSMPEIRLRPGAS